MKITFDEKALFKITSKREEHMMEALHDYLDSMYFAN